MKKIVTLLLLLSCLDSIGQDIASLSYPNSVRETDLSDNSHNKENMTRVDSSSEKFYNNSIQLVLGGLGGGYSISYERQLQSDKLNISAEIGYSFVPVNLGWNINHSFIGAINGQLGRNKHKFEFGPIMNLYTRGNPTDPAILVIEGEKPFGIYLGGRIGYRLELPDKRFLFKAHFILAKNNSIIFPWGSLTLGYRF